MERRGSVDAHGLLSHHFEVDIKNLHRARAMGNRCRGGRAAKPSAPAETDINSPRWEKERADTLVRLWSAGVGGWGSTHLAGVALAPFKDTRVVVAGHVPHAAERVVDVLAQRGRAGAVLAAADAELGRRDEVGPLVQLLELPERGREDKAADGVACVRWGRGASDCALRVWSCT